jgi:tetratricopeptide (TPR) repeat protein
MALADSEWFDGRMMAERFRKTVAGLTLMAALVSAGCETLPAAETLNADASLTAQPGGGVQPKTSPTENLVRIADQIEARGSVETALPLYQRAAESPGADAAVYTRLADAYAKLGRYPEAERTYQAALAKQSGYGLALLGLGGVLIRMGRSEEGLAALVKAAPIVNQASAYDRLGVAHMVMGQPREALASFEQAHSMDSADIDIATNLALAAALSGQYDKAATLAKRVTISPDLKEYHRRNLVLILGIAGRAEEARAAAAQLDSVTAEQLLTQARDLRAIASPKARALALGTVNAKAVATR